MRCGMLALTAGSVALAWSWPESADQLLFLQLATLAFFWGLRAGAAWLLPTWLAYNQVVFDTFDRLCFAGFCVYGLLIAGVSTRKYRLARWNEQQVISSLEIARQVQISLQPGPLIEWRGVELASSIQMARQLGGDLVCFQAHDDSFFVLVGDVMGKGAQAALTAAYVKGLFDELARSAQEPRELLLGLHQHLERRTVTDSFLAAVCIQADLHANCWRICRAGLPPAFLVRGDGTHETVPDPGIMLGVPLSPELVVFETEHRPGDQLFLASDGLLEEEEAPGELLDSIASHSTLPAPTALDASCSVLRGRLRSAVDDETAILIRW